MRSFIAIAALALFAIVFVSGCTSDGIYLPYGEGKAWVKMDPVQCLGNAWEVDWLENNGGNYSAYPRDVIKRGRELEEIGIINDYYEKQGIPISNIITVDTYDVVCEACSCPQGYTLYVQVDKSDVFGMVDLGFNVV